MGPVVFDCSFAQYPLQKKDAKNVELALEPVKKTRFSRRRENTRFLSVTFVPAAELAGLSVPIRQLNQKEKKSDKFT